MPEPLGKGCPAGISQAHPLQTVGGIQALYVSQLLQVLSVCPSTLYPGITAHQNYAHGHEDCGELSEALLTPHQS